MKPLRYLIVILVLMLAGLVAFAQETITPIGEPENPNLQISFPPPVYVVSGTVDVLGTVDVPNMANYFLEFRPLVLTDDAEETDATRPWFPASLPASGTVTDGVIAPWNTTTAPDGLYELRLTVNIDREETRYFRVSPLRIDNKSAELTPTQPGSPPRPTLVPSPTGLPGQVNPRPSQVPTLPPNSGPVVIASQNANVRSGDSTIYPRLGVLFRNEPAPILGISSTGSGWYYIQLPNGSRGFIAPSVVRTEGNLVGLQPIVPPPPPPTFTPSPTFTPTPIPPTATPVTPANLAIVSVQLSPAAPACGSSYQVNVTVINNGTGTTPAGFAVSAADRHTASGTTAASTLGSVPALQPGQTFVSEMYLTANTFFNEGHTVAVTVDSGGQVAETNEGDNTTSVAYTLGQGSC
jgi:hypothetical protein